MVSLNMSKFIEKLDETSECQQTKEEKQKEWFYSKIIFNAESLDECNVSTDELLYILSNADKLVAKAQYFLNALDNISYSLRDSKAMFIDRLI